MTKLPLVIMAGFDLHPAVLPQSGADKHPLVGSKGLDIRLGDEALIDVLLQRVVASDAFGAIYIAGPVSAYGERRGVATVIDTEGSFGHNIAVAIDELTRRHPGEPIALTTCDIVPELADLQTAMAQHDAVAPVDFWFPIIAAPPDPEELGASAWKPQYRVVPDAGLPAVSVLPGHLMVVHPEVCRAELVLRAFDLAYGSRNRPILYRLLYIVGGLLGTLLAADFRGLLRARPPIQTASALYHAVALAWRLRAERSTPEELASHLRALFIERRHRQRHPERAGRLVVLSAVSLAKDIDTEEEAAELRRTVARRGRLRGRRRRRVREAAPVQKHP